MTAKLLRNRKAMINKRYKIRTRVMTVISVMLFSIFSLIGIIFNIVAGRYIQNSAIDQLNRSFNIVQEVVERTEAILFEFPRELFNDRTASIFVRNNDFRIEPNMFILDDGYNPLGNSVLSDKSAEVLGLISGRSIDLESLKNRLFNTTDGVYYVSSYQLPFMRTGEKVFCIIYADVTGLHNFARTINMFLILLVCISFAVAALLALFLSRSITDPIQKLCTFARNIGKGDFTSMDYMFKDREFEDLNIVLNKSAKQLSVYDIEQKAFFQNVSHELRTPLMSIQCYAEGISCGLMEPKKASDTILLETARLNEMIKDLLYISKIDNITSAYPVTKVDLIDLIRKCAARHQGIADKKNIHFTFNFSESSVYAECVDELISRAIDNLISNAIRYASSEIVLFCGRKPEMIEICVKDDGAGIHADIMPHLFERFYKGEDGNYGIGLSIVKSIIEQHGGIVKAENTDSGAAFTITMPGLG